MAKFHVDSRLTTQVAITSTFKTQVSITAATATLCRGRVYEMNFGADGAPNATDCNIVYDVSRQTNITTGAGGAAVTALALDPANVTTRAVNWAGWTTDPSTITANSTVFDQTLNQRASQRWVAMDQDSMLYWPATNLNGLAFRALSPTYAANVLYNIYYEDL
jgi:hypothetical protein